MNEHTSFTNWFETFRHNQQYKELLAEPVAYFCAEYALFDHSPLYAGGLGILAGDYVQEMIDQEFPCVALGLFYYHEHIYGKPNSLDVVTPDKLGLELVRAESEEPHIITIPIGERDVKIQAWRWQQGDVTVLMLDTHVESNHPEDQTITDTLYVENRDMRLKQEMVLGIGGMRFLKALGIHPSLYHLNEGHSAFLVFELIRHEMKHRNVDFMSACQLAKKHIVFTNHTLVAAGHELYALEAVKYMAGNFAKDLGINVEQLIALGVEGNSNLFSMNTMALNLSSKVNAVSVIHGEKARELWKNYAVEVVTNGIFLRRWDAWAIADVDYINEQDAWSEHQKNKKVLLDIIKRQTDETFDENVLLLGWARRFVSYKQPLAILGDIERLKKLAQTQGRQVRIVFSGPVNESYAGDNEFVQALERYTQNELKGIMVFLPNYEIPLAKVLISGCDVWLNTPIVGTEACGTSGMKAALNGVVPLTTNDGWIAETDLTSSGYVVNDGQGSIQVLTKNLFDTLENMIIPEYYGQGDTKWIVRMKNARELVKKQFSMSRALKEYIQKFYIPTLENKKH